MTFRANSLKCVLWCFQQARQPHAVALVLGHHRVYAADHGLDGPSHVQACPNRGLDREDGCPGCPSRARQQGKVRVSRRTAQLSLVRHLHLGKHVVWFGSGPASTMRRRRGGGWWQCESSWLYILDRFRCILLLCACVNTVMCWFVHRESLHFCLCSPVSLRSQASAFMESCFREKEACASASSRPVYDQCSRSWYLSSWCADHAHCISIGHSKVALQDRCSVSEDTSEGLLNADRW